ncbi:MAG: flagellar hook-length control protein FliK, partial [Ignavibacteriaceae bacterium]|nr:flagellar hook-length control protein FliK [Ignavibacteriaceae bacterium]
SANTAESFFTKAQTNFRQVSDSTNNYSSATEINNSINNVNTAGSFFANVQASADQVYGNYTSSIKNENPTNNANTAESFFVSARTNQNNTIGSNVNESAGKNNDSNLLNNATANASDNNEMVVVTISSKLNNNTVITDVQNTNAAKPQEVSLNLVKTNIPTDDGNVALKNYKLPVPSDKTEVASKGNIDALSAKADTFTMAKTSNVSAAASSTEPKGEVKNITADSEFVSNLSKADNSSVMSTDGSTQAVSDDVSKNIAVKDNQISQTGITIGQSDNSSTGLTGDAAQVKAGTQEVSQVLNTKHSNNSSDQQQNKSSDGKNGSDSKVFDQVTGNLFSQAADSVKEKFASQATTADVPEKTIKITEITKEISNIIQQNSVKSIVLQLKPESLGKIKVTVDVDNNLVNAKVEVDTEAVRQIVQNNSLELTNSLSSNGMHLSSLSVNVSSGEQKSYQPFNQKKKSGYSSGSKIMEDSVSLSTAKSLGYNTYEYLV